MQGVSVLGSFGFAMLARHLMQTSMVCHILGIKLGESTKTGLVQLPAPLQHLDRHSRECSILALILLASAGHGGSTLKGVDIFRRFQSGSQLPCG